MAEIIVCPSGLSGQVRGLKTKEADILASANNVRSRPGVINKVLGGCWETTENSGPYEFEGPPNWDQVLQGDRMFVLMAIRRVTHGSDYVFKAQCQQAGCLSRFDWGVEINELDVRLLSEESAKNFRNGNTFETECDDKLVKYRLPTGADEKRAAKLRDQHRKAILTLALRMRIIDVEGIDQAQVRHWINDLDLGVAEQLLEAFDEHDCGIDTILEIECPECFVVFDVDLPFDQSFFFPSKGKGREKAKRARLQAI